MVMKFFRDLDIFSAWPFTCKWPRRQQEAPSGCVLLPGWADDSHGRNLAHMEHSSIHASTMAFVGALHDLRT